MGDERTYARPVILRAVESSDAMTADWAKLPYEVLAKISGRIVAEVPGVNRVSSGSDFRGLTLRNAFLQKLTFPQVKQGFRSVRTKPFLTDKNA